MKVGIFVTPNHKGQIVIPQKVRDELGITSETILHLTQAGKSIVLHPVSDVIHLEDSESSYKDILQKTQGAWGRVPEPKAIRRTQELVASKRRKQPW